MMPLCGFWEKVGGEVRGSVVLEDVGGVEAEERSGGGFTGGLLEHTLI